MSLSEPIAVVIGSLITGVPTSAAALYAYFRERPASRRAREQAADGLSDRLDQQYHSEITYLRQENRYLRHELAARGEDNDTG